MRYKFGTRNRVSFPHFPRLFQRPRKEKAWRIHSKRTTLLLDFPMFPCCLCNKKTGVDLVVSTRFEYEISVFYFTSSKLISTNNQRFSKLWYKYDTKTNVFVRFCDQNDLSKNWWQRYKKYQYKYQLIN